MRTSKTATFVHVLNSTWHVNCLQGSADNISSEKEKYDSCEVTLPWLAMLIYLAETLCVKDFLKSDMILLMGKD